MARTYSEKLKDPRWQKKRLEILERDEWKCSLCGEEEVTLHVHHVNYEAGRDPWDYDDDNFVSMCETCHELTEKMIRWLRMLAVNPRFFENRREFSRLICLCLNNLRIGNGILGMVRLKGDDGNCVLEKLVDVSSDLWFGGARWAERRYVDKDDFAK